MAYGGGGEQFDITLPAAADLSSNQYRFITVDSNGRGTIATNNTMPLIGILQNKPAAVDAPARVRISGLSRLVGGGALTAGSVVCSNSQGFGTVSPLATTGVMVGAICIASTGASADIGDVLIHRYLA